MRDDLFKGNGNDKIKRTGPDEYTMSVQIPTDADGLVGRECPDYSCSPGYFKVKLGTGIIEGHEEAYCPYCRHASEPSGFMTKAQVEYAKNIVLREAERGISNMIENALGLGPSRKKRFGGDFISIEMSYKPGRLPQVRPPIEEELRRDVTCPKCGLEHAVFGLASWCPDCGSDIFLVHVDKEFAVVRCMLGDVKRRHEQLGARVAARDVENALEDSVSIFEAALRAMTKRYMKNSGNSDQDINDVLRKRVANRYQSIQLAAEVWEREFGIELFKDCDKTGVETLRSTFEKRHPITHNLGIVDRKYMERVRSGELEGRDVPVTVEEIEGAIAFSSQVLQKLHPRLFKSAP
jgi:predicted  nucleic acid-binding Zn-ribbon protein